MARERAGAAGDVLISDVERFYSERHAFSETTTRQFEGPYGSWKVRLELIKKRDTWNMYIHPPASSDLPVTYCLKALRKILAVNAERRSPTNEIYVDENNALMQTCATIIQIAYHAHKLRMVISQVRETEDKMIDLQVTYAMLNDEKSALHTRFFNTSNIAGFRNTNVRVYDMMHLSTFELSFTSRSSNCREDVRKHALSVIESSRMPSIELLCAKSIKKQSFPMLIGCLPIRFAHVRSSDGIAHYINCAKISAEHTVALKKHFNKNWAHHCEHMCTVFTDSVQCIERIVDGKFKAGMLLKRMVIRTAGIYSIAVSIESFVSKEKGSGHGSRMFNDIYVLARLNVKNSQRIDVIAQCLPIDFWDCRCDETGFARSLVLQMSMMQESYEIYETCTPRSVQMYVSADGSPQRN